MNQGLTNHSKFRTKYWQDKQAIHLEHSQFLETSLIKGHHIDNIFSNQHYRTLNSR